MACATFARYQETNKQQWKGTCPWKRDQADLGRVDDCTDPVRAEDLVRVIGPSLPSGQQADLDRVRKESDVIEEEAAPPQLMSVSAGRTPRDAIGPCL